MSITGPIFDAVCNNDLRTVKLLIEQFPEYHKIVNESGQTLLHAAILSVQYEIFDYLLSLGKFDLNAPTLRDETPLFLSVLDESTEYFARELIKRGADIHRLYYCDNTLLHMALRNHQLKISQLLIQRGIDINAQNANGRTPLHMLFFIKWNPDEIDEGVGMMMYYGADASIPNNNGRVPFELGVEYDSVLVEVLESLFYYTFDEFSEYEMPVEVLFELAQTNSQLLFQINKCWSGVALHRNYHLDPLFLFNIRPQYLKLLLKRFDYVIRKILEGGPIISWYEFRNFENCEILLKSHLRDDTLEFIKKLKISWIVTTMSKDKVSSKIIISFVFYLLTLGIDVFNKDLDIVYQNYGYCDLFKLLLFLEIETSDIECDIVPRIIYDVETDLVSLLTHTNNYSLKGVEALLDYFAHPKVKQFCLNLGTDRLVTKVKTMPQVPLLLELARDSARKFLVQRYKLKKSKQLCSLLKWLPISSAHERILSFETKLYE